MLQEQQDNTNKRLFEQVDNNRVENEMILKQTKVLPLMPDIKQPEFNNVIYIKTQSVDSVKRKKRFNPLKIISKIL